MLRLVPCIITAHRSGISYVTLMMDKNDNLYAQKGRGRPSKQQSEQLFLHRELKDELKQLRKDMTIQNVQEVLHSITIADDDMIRHVHMFPEVMFMGVIANTNRQQRDLFLMVVKDTSGECFICNATLLPCVNCGCLSNFIGISSFSYMGR